MNFTIRQLQYFVKVVDTGTISGAAQACHVAQPALGVQIKQLEKALGVRLLERHPRGMTATSAGLRFYQHCAAILNKCEQAARDLGQFDAEQGDAVLVGLTNATTRIFGEELLKRIETSTIKDKVKIIESSSSALDDMLRNDEIDVCISYSAQPITGITKTRIFSENLFFAIGTEEGLNDEISFKEVIEQKLLMQGKGDAVRNLVEQQAALFGMSTQIAYEVQSIGMTKKLAAKGPYGTVMTASSIDEERREGKLHAARIVDPEISRAIYLSIHGSITLDSIQGELLKIMDKLIRIDSAKSLDHLTPAFSGQMPLFSALEDEDYQFAS